MPESTASPRVIAARSTCHDCHFMAIEGIPYFFTDDETGELLGGGSETWIYESEDALGLTRGQRTVLPGLRLPRSLREAIDPKIGVLQTQSVTIRLVDYGGELASLFATEGKDFSILGQDIQPGTSNLGTSVTISGGLTINPRGRYIGLEHIGTSGERSHISPFPFPLVGYHHVVNAYGQGEEGPRPIPISSSPLDFTGRRVAIYRLVRRNFPMGYGLEAWPLWGEQYEDLGVLWIGKLQDKGTISGDREWDIRCNGALSWLQRSVNQWAPGWGPVVDSPRTLSAAQRQVAIRFFHNESSGLGPVSDRSVGYRTTLSATGDQETWVAELAALISSVASGAVSDYGSTDWEDFNGASAGILADGTFWVQRNPNAADYSNVGGVAYQVCMCETAWRMLGFDPPLQAVDPPLAEETQLPFVRVDAGQYVFAFDAVGGMCPADGFWSCIFSSVALNREADIYSPGATGSENDGNPRYYRPVNNGNPLILAGPSEVPQLLRLAVDQPYLESLPTVPRSDATIGGTAVTHARYFALRGQRAVGTALGAGQLLDENGSLVHLEDVEAEDFATLIRAEWRATTYGQLVEDDGRPTLSIGRYEDPRLAGMPYQPMDSEWSAINTPAAPGIEIAPLLTYGYGAAMSLGRAIECFYQLMLSTGTATGYATSEASDPTFVSGSNTHAGQSESWCVDSMRADHGLGIPSELVTPPDDAAEEWDRVPGGKGGALSRIGLAYVGPQNAVDILASIMRPRALSFSLHGGRFGVRFLAPFAPGDADVTIGVDDLWDPSSLSDPATLIPKQELRAMGQIDRAILSYRYNPIDGGTALEKTFRARDREAQARRGDLKIELRDDGLIPGEWQAPGVPAWELSFRELWEVDRAEFFSRRHFLVTDLTVNRIKGRDIRVGTRALLTNPWPVNPAGPNGNGADAQGYGLQSLCGTVLDWQYNTEQRSYTLQILVFAGQATGVRMFMPVAKIASRSSAVLTLEAENEEAGLSGASRFARPSWVDQTLNQANVRILSYDRTSYTLSSVYTISSVVGNTVTLTGAPTASDAYRDRELFLVMAEYGQQTGRWPAAHCSPIVLDTLQHPGGQGFPLEP